MNDVATCCTPPHTPHATYSAWNPCAARWSHQLLKLLRGHIPDHLTHLIRDMDTLEYDRDPFH